MPKANPASPHRKRGAPPGNTNALKHGLYARGLLHREKQLLDLKPPDDFLDEIGLLRLTIKRLAIALNSNDFSNVESIEAARIITQAIGRLEKLYRLHCLISKQNVWLSVMLGRRRP